MPAIDRSLQSGTIDVDNVSFAYRDDNLVLKNINLSVPSRNFVALVGHTGSGKSTLASLLMGYYPLTEGEIRLDGRPLSTLSHSALRQGVAMVQQDRSWLTFQPIRWSTIRTAIRCWIRESLSVAPIAKRR